MYLDKIIKLIGGNQMTQYNIWKDGKIIDSTMAQVKLDYMTKRLKQLNGNVLHVINGDVISVYKNVNNRVKFSHTFTREGR